MKEIHARAKSVAVPILACVFLLVCQKVVAQSYRLHCDGISATSGGWSSSTYTLRGFAGQPGPVEISSNANYLLLPGFLACITNLQPCTGAAVARVQSPATPAQGSEIQVRLLIDMSGIPVPDQRLGSFTGTLRWNPALLTYLNNSALQSGFVGALNTDNVGAGMLEFNGASAAGASGELAILGITFEVDGTVGANGILDLNYTDMLAAGTFQNLLTCLTVNDGAFTIAPAALCRVCGDVNDDGTAGSSDALIILSYDVGIPIPAALLDKINAGCGDVNSDGATGSSDALIILSFDAGLPVPFPVGTPGGCGSSREGPRPVQSPKIAPQVSASRSGG